MNGLKLGVVIYTTTKQDQAIAQMDIIRETWKELFKDIIIIHAYNGLDEYINHTEDESVLCDNHSHYEGAANMIDKGMAAMMKYDRDYIIVSASDCRWTNPEKLMGMLIEMRLNNKYLASCPWGNELQDDWKIYGLACDTFIINAHRESQNHVFPLAYGEFYKKNIDILHYLGKYTVPVENLLAAKFISACSRGTNNSDIKNIVNKSLYLIKERMPMFTTNLRNFDCPDIGLFTNHLPLQEKFSLLYK